MTVEQHDPVDFVSVSPAGELALTISDYLAWDKANEPLLCLQEKLNCYLRSSGAVSFSNATRLPLAIGLVSRCGAPISRT
jgi:hypothetical protein